VLQFVFHPAAYLHQLVPMQNQLPQVALLPIRRPQTRKPVFQHQLQDVRRIALVRLLLAHVTGPDLRRIPDQNRVPQILHQLDEPLTVTGRFHADQHRRRHLLVEKFGVSAGMHQPALAALPRLRLQPTHLLPAGMEITPYNHHCEGSFLPSVFGPQIKTTGFRIEPSFLSNQSRREAKGASSYCAVTPFKNT
jgi:hypothetical protein